jgi:TP901-1 family phage major tail protein
MAKLDGYDILVQTDAVAVVGQTGAGLDFVSDMIEITTKDSNKFKEYLAGEKGGTITIDGLYDVDTGANNTEDVFANLLAGTEVTWKWGKYATAGDKYFTGSAFISSLNMSAPKNEAATYSMTLQVTGEFSIVTVT